MTIATQSRLSLLAAAALLVLGAAVFAYGYFYVDDRMLSDTAVVDRKIELGADALRNMQLISADCGRRAAPQFTRLVFVVIDAFRADFIGLRPRTSSSALHSVAKYRMPFTESLLHSGHALGVVSVAHTPTVTMPRIKALLSGTLPSFVDLIRNLNAPKFGDDNIVQRAFDAGKRMIFYGDDTWLAMFDATMFVRSNGTSSFFATDYVQVDSNVTEAMLPELSPARMAEWDFLFCHYLGVDHIGHSHGGARSHLLQNKFLEMDRVVESVWHAVAGQDALIVVTGDHGMTEAGNHGGDTRDETDTAAIFIDARNVRNYSTQHSTVRVPQVDIATTLALLLGLPIPAKSKGKAIASLLDALHIQPATRLCYLFDNAVQYMKIDAARDGRHNVAQDELLTVALARHASALDEQHAHSTSASKHYANYLDAVQHSVLSQNSSGATNIFTLLVGLFSTFIAFSCLLHRQRQRCRSNATSSSITSSSAIFGNKSFFTVIHVAHFPLYAILLTSTSFIETEHFYWYFISSSAVVASFGSTVSKFYRELHTKKTLAASSAISKTDAHAANFHPPSRTRAVASFIEPVISFTLLLIGVRVLSVWSTLNESFVSDWLTAANRKRIISALVILSFVVITAVVPRTRRQRCILASGLFWTYLYRCDNNQLTAFRSMLFAQLGYTFALDATAKAQIVYMHLLLLALEQCIRTLKPDTNWLTLVDMFITSSTRAESSTKYSSDGLRCVGVLLALLAALLSKVQTIPVIAINMLLEQLLHSATRHGDRALRHPTTLTAFYLTFASTGFFSTGNSNLISTIDVSAGYVGLSAYNAIIVACLLTLNTYSMLLYWLVALFVRLDEDAAERTAHASVRLQTLLNCVEFILLLRTFILFVFQVVAVVLQNHLFIWSVICPKLLYESSLAVLTVVVCLLVIALKR